MTQASVAKRRLRVAPLVLAALAVALVAPPAPGLDAQPAGTAGERRGTCRDEVPTLAGDVVILLDRSTSIARKKRWPEVLDLARAFGRLSGPTCAQGVPVRLLPFPTPGTGQRAERSAEVGDLIDLCATGGVVQVADAPCSGAETPLMEALGVARGLERHGPRVVLVVADRSPGSVGHEWRDEELNSAVEADPDVALGFIDVAAGGDGREPPKLVVSWPGAREDGSSGLGAAAVAESAWAAALDRLGAWAPGARSREPLDQVVAVGADGWHCSGVLVAPRAVLTAAHCLPARRILVGADVRAGGTEIGVERAERHPNATVDAAVLILATDAPQRVKPVALSADGRSRPMHLRVAGFGAVDSSGLHGFGHKHRFDVHQSGWGCDPARARAFGCDPDQHLLLRAPGGRDTCDGDSGGPVLERLTSPSECSWRLVAITSRPLAHAAVRCGGGGLYQRIDPLVPWLRRTAGLTESPGGS